ncbi:MAG: tetratricopeptide repeat protein, partial [Chloroflexi bacterium]|nr:tetratricopeptide repeat protein [Chloroflexota bacterium]
MEIKSFGKYTVIQPLGSGGMAAVYAARDALLDRRVAIKVIHPHLAQEGSFADRFRQEARLVSALRHPHIVRLYDFDILNDQPYMVMEYLEGGTLKDRLSLLRRQGKRLPLESAAQILRALAGALDYAHARGAVHRDIKPANILFTAQDEAVITDFGIVKLLHESAQLSHTGGVIGTPAYMSPEQVSGKAVDGRSDQYSLAIMLYEMVAGQTPFVADTVSALLVAQLTEAPPQPRRFNPRLPALAEQALLRALEKDPAARYPSAAEFAAAFSAALQGQDAATQAEDRLPGPAEDRLPEGDQAATEIAAAPQAAAASVALPAEAPALAKTRTLLPPALARRGRLIGGLATLLALAVVLFFSLGGLNLFRASPAAPPGGYSLAVANFDGAQASIKVDFGRRIYEQLESELADLSGEVRIARLERVFTSADEARKAGQEAGYSIVIWGWYDDLGVSPRIEVVQPSAPSAERAGLFLQSAQAAGLAEAGGAAQLDLGDFFSYLRVPHWVDEMALFVEHGPDQVAYISEAVLALAYQSQGQLDVALTLYDKALAKAAAAPPGESAAGIDVIYMQRAIGLAETGRMAEALQDLEQARAANPQLPEAHYNLAILYAETCSPALRSEEAVESAEEAVRLRPEDIPSRRLLAGLYAQQGDLSRALQSAQAALELDPKDAETLLLLASLYAATGSEKEVRATYTEAIAIRQAALAGEGGETFERRIALGDAYLQSGDLEKAGQEYQQADNLKPGDPNIHRGLGSVALQSNRLEEAADQFQRWTESDAQNSSAFTLLGLTYLKLGRKAEMLAAFDQAASLSPCDPAPRLLLGGHYWTQGDQAKATAEYSQAAQLQPQNPTSLYLLGVTQYFLGDTEEAQSALSQAVALDPSLSQARYALGSLYYQQGEYAQARDEFQTVAKDDPQDASALTSLGNAHYELGDIEASIAAYRQALAVQDDPNVHAYLGLIYSEHGEVELAIQEYEEALAGDPQMTLAHRGLGDALVQDGDFAAAAQAYRQALALEEDASLRAQLAALLTRLGNVEEAVLELEQAVQADGQNPLYRNQVAALYSRLGRLDDAEEAYQALISLDGESPAGSFGLGQLAYKQCDLSGMSQHYAQAAALGGQQAVYFSLPASAYAAQGDFEAQAQGMTDLVERFPADPLAQLLVGEYFLGQGKLREAEDALQSVAQAAGLPPLFLSLAHYDLGQLQLLRGNLAAAEGEFNLALEQFPANAAAQIALGDLALRNGDAQAALQAYQEAEGLLAEYGYQVSGDSAELLKPLLTSRRALAQAKMGSAANPAAAVALAETIVENTPQW